MSDEMDECACFWSNEFAMRRLLALLRQGQAYCTDSECIDLPLSGPTAQRATDDGNNFTMMSMLLIFAVILYFFRPNSLRRSTNEMKKLSQEPPNNGQGPDDAPPSVN